WHYRSVLLSHHRAPSRRRGPSRRQHHSLLHLRHYTGIAGTTTAVDTGAATGFAARLATDRLTGRVGLGDGRGLLSLSLPFITPAATAPRDSASADFWRQSPVRLNSACRSDLPRKSLTGDNLRLG